MTEKAYLAIDMGTSSGRHVVGRFDGQRLHLEEVYRFENGGVDLAGSLFWDLPALWNHVRNGMRTAGSRFGREIVSVGVDTWGVDFGLLGRNDTLLGNPYHYRDCRTNGLMERAFSIVPREEIFRHTGLQFMQFNTLYQLLAMKLARSPLLDAAETMLMVPNLFHWLMTGQKCNEFTEATTSQFYNPLKRDWAVELLRKFDLPTRLLGRIVEPGADLGGLRPNLANDSGLTTAHVVLPGTHDTASAVMAVPAVSKPGQRPDWCYISLGTWALMGVESPQPVVNDRVLALNFTNEGGVGSTFRLLKNIIGMWLLQECRRVWNQSGQNYGWEDLNKLSAAAKPLVSFINPDAQDFLAPENMPQAIRRFCEKTGQAVPPDEGAVLRCAGEHCHEVPPRAGHVRGPGRRPHRNGAYRRRGNAKPANLPGRGRRLRPPGRGRSHRGHGHRQHHDASRRRRRRVQYCPSPRSHPPQFPRRGIRAPQRAGVGRSVRKISRAGEE